ncbi:MAG: hypothetical protein HY704_02010 [Gemmatimonadetes bacterium]|nr:hypothetical protein [Gemmatimonadota bacterium]
MTHLVKCLSLIAVAALLFAAVPATGWAHGEGVLKSSGSSAAAGSSLPVQGSSFERGVHLRLVLVGALEEYALGEATADSAGAFALEVRVPREAKTGQYRLVAVAPDGDRVATLDLMVTEAGADAGGPESEPASEQHAGHEEVQAAARADEMPMERPWSGAEWGVIGLLIGLAGGLGIALLRRGATGR